MPALPLTTAIATYGHTRPLKDGTVYSERVVLKHVDVAPITSAFRRMVRGLEFDVAEMAFSTYLCARARAGVASGTTEQLQAHRPRHTAPLGLGVPQLLSEEV